VDGWLQAAVLGLPMVDAPANGRTYPTGHHEPILGSHDMNTTCIGVIYIGQAPRPDCIAQLRLLLGSELDIVEAGALDGVSRSDIETFIPNGSHDTLFTRLPDGDELIISKAQVTKRTQRHIERFMADGIDVILMFCTGTFEGLEPRGHVVFPSAVLTNWVQAVLPRGRLGVFTPLPSQVEQTASKWAAAHWEVLVEPLLPGMTAPDDMEAAAWHIAEFKPDLIVLDCMGYSQWTKERIRAITGVRTALAVSIATRTIQELIV